MWLKLKEMDEKVYMYKCDRNGKKCDENKWKWWKLIEID